ncbi:MAG TPA: biotin--[acetyl-CoA-carboxylase] ligase [Deltaproteobacteria bacterium]|nr:MAG: biotin--[acetyl-CoA-carboxylase] ligase [Deltaproteobacteria bacterium GWC2_65_14]HBO69788.1 biotin--[acetyl-CoA-carboxylase] ligase [Deltaproteobacteria bacterium]
MAEQLRRILEEHPGRYVSGEEIGRRLGASRAAVWKQVQTLRRRGFGIEGARGAGYRLLGRPDLIEKQELFSRLPDASMWKSFHVFPVTDSTNSRAVHLAEAGAPHGTVLCADSQTAGRGRLGSRWESPPGVNLYLSLLLRPPFEPPMAPRLTLVAAVALASTVEEATGLPVFLKWPNDLFLGGRKTAGILAEMSSDLDRLRHVVIGVGLNVNAEAADFPEELRRTATSLRGETGRSFPRVELLSRFLVRFEEAYQRFLAGGLAPLLPEWNRRCLLSGKRVLLRRRDREERGTAIRVDEEGALLFLPEGGRGRERIHSGEILEFER